MWLKLQIPPTKLQTLFNSLTLEAQLEPSSPRSIFYRASQEAWPYVYAVSGTFVTCKVTIYTFTITIFIDLQPSVSETVVFVYMMNSDFLEDEDCTS